MPARAETAKIVRVKFVGCSLPDIVDVMLDNDSVQVTMTPQSKPFYEGEADAAFQPAKNKKLLTPKNLPSTVRAACNVSGTLKRDDTVVRTWVAVYEVQCESRWGLTVKATKKVRSFAYRVATDAAQYCENPRSGETRLEPDSPLPIDHLGYNQPVVLGVTAGGSAIEYEVRQTDLPDAGRTVKLSDLTPRPTVKDTFGGTGRNNKALKDAQNATLSNITLTVK